ncbi:MAG TPA: condensation domain-containing protein, partial [Longimicrobium sp.]|nr:condensation domain-containing protein [Longimicrobium sp.]
MTLRNGAARARLAELLGRRMEAARVFPCSPAQEGLWFLDRRDPGNPAYNLVMAADLRGPLDVPALGRAVEEVVRRHEALRTTFESRDGTPFQRVSPAGPVPFPIKRIDASSGGDAVRLWTETEARRPFDLARGPLFRAALLAVLDARHHLLLATHHAVFDGWSMEVLLREIGAAYAAFSAGRTSPLAPVAMQYADFAAWQQAQIRDGALEDELRRRAAQLEGAPALLPLPTDRPRGTAPLPRSGAAALAMPSTVYAGAAALARESGTTPFAALLAAFAVLLGRRTGEDDLVIGIPSAGRARAEFQDTIGFFVDTLPLRIRLGGDPIFGEVLRRVRDTLLDALSGPAVPFPLLLDRLGVERVAGAEPLVQVMFAMSEVPAAPLVLGDARGEVTTVDSGTGKFDLSFYAAPADGALSSRLLYRADLFDATTADAMLAQLARLLEQAVADPSRRVSELELLSAEEHELVVAAWNRTAAAYPRERCVHELFAEQAALAPDAPALDGDSGALSYGHLEARANRLAHLLRARGVGADTRVGVLLERGPELVVALLAILKAGGAYVPLDPEYPAERLAFMLRDSGAALVLSDSAPSEPLEGAPCPVLRMDAEALDDQPHTPPE